ncbi:MAG: nitroreductase family protein [Fimbriimonadaceae bacterium]
MTVKEAATARRSIRKPTKTPPSQQTSKSSLRVAELAPSPWNLQPWRVKVVVSPEMKEKLMAASYGQPQVGAAQAVFVIGNDMNDVLANVEETVHPGYGDKIPEVAQNVKETMQKMSEGDLQWWGKSQGYTFMAFLLLQAQAMGYSTSAMLGFDPVEVRKLFGWGDHVQISAIVAMGVADEDGFPSHRHPLERFTEIV